MSQETMKATRVSCPGYDIKPNLMVRLRFWSLANVDYLFIVITFESTLVRINSPC